MATNKLNELECLTDDGVNTGKPSCIEDIGLPVGIVLVQKNKVYTRTEIAMMEATFAADSIADLQRDRIFYIGQFEAVEKSGTDRQQQTYGFGRVRTVRRGKLGWTFTIATGGKFYHTEIMGFDEKSDQYDALIIGDAGKIAGTVKKDENDQNGLGGYSLSDIYVGDYEIADGSNGSQFLLTIELADSSQFNKRYASVSVDFDIESTFVGLQTAHLEDLTPDPGIANKIVIRGNVNGVNLADAYGASIAVSGAWTIINIATGAAVVVSAVALVLGNYELTLTTGTGLTVSVSLKAPSVLAGLTVPVVGVESDILSPVLVP